MKTKGYIFLLTLLVSVGGCGKKKKGIEIKKHTSTHVDIPVADEGIRHFFEEDINEFTLDEAGLANKIDAASDEFAWENIDQAGQNFKVVYFDFDRFAIKEDQQGAVEYDFAKIKNSLDEAAKKNVNPVVVIEGHACHSAGSAVYNLAISEKRAKVLRDELVAHGIAPEHIKIVGRGKEVPAIVNGKVVTGDRSAQWANRRDEVRVIFS